MDPDPRAVRSALRVVAEARVARLASCLAGDMGWHTLEQGEYEYFVMAVTCLRAFGGVAAVHHGQPAAAVYYTLVCCRVTGVSRAFDMARAMRAPGSPGSIDLGAHGGVTAAGKQFALARMKETFAGMIDGPGGAGRASDGRGGKKGYRLWNPSVLGGIADGEPWRETTSVMAYNIDVWRMLEERVEGWRGAADIGARVTRKLHDGRVCERYDCLFPADLPLLSVWVLTPSATGDGHCGNPACDVRAEAGARFQRCSGCEQISYCSAACQRHDWKNHKIMCKIAEHCAVKAIRM
jgi:hypothetical protein